VGPKFSAANKKTNGLEVPEDEIKKKWSGSARR